MGVENASVPKNRSFNLRTEIDQSFYRLKVHQIKPITGIKTFVSIPKDVTNKKYSYIRSIFCPEYRPMQIIPNRV